VLLLLVAVALLVASSEAVNACISKEAIVRKLKDGTATAAEIKEFRTAVNLNLAEIISDNDYNGGAKGAKFCGMAKIPTTVELYHGNVADKFANLQGAPYSNGKQKLGSGIYFTPQKMLSVGYAKNAGIGAKKPAKLYTGTVMKATFCPIVSFHPEYFNDPLKEFLSNCGFDCVSDDMANEYEKDGFKIWTLIAKKNGWEKQYWQDIMISGYRGSPCGTYDGTINEFYTLDNANVYEVVMFKDSLVTNKTGLLDVSTAPRLAQRRQHKLSKLLESVQAKL